MIIKPLTAVALDRIRSHGDVWEQEEERVTHLRGGHTSTCYKLRSVKDDTVFWWDSSEFEVVTVIK